MTDISLSKMLAILDHLANNDGVTLGDLSRQFDLSCSYIYSKLWALHTLDVAHTNLNMPPSPFDVFGDNPLFTAPKNSKLPPNITKDTVLPRISPYAHSEFVKVTFSLPELVLTLHIIDDLLEVTPPSHGKENLLSLRHKLRQSGNRYGFDDVLWEAPDPILSENFSERIVDAIDQRATLHIGYSRFDSETCSENYHEYTAIPVRIEGGARPILWCELVDGGVRSFRLDRMARVGLGKKISAKRAKEAAEAVKMSLEQSHTFEDGIPVRITITRQGLWAAEELPDISVDESGENLILTLSARNKDFLATYLALLGDSVIALEPPSVAQEMTNIFRQLREEYE